MISDDVQRIELDARRRSLDEYKLRCQDLRGENDSLKVEKDQRETDALQIISFLRRDAERKDELIESLKNTINQQRDLFAQQREEERQQAADGLQEKEAEWGAKETQMQSQLDHLGNELDALQTFKEQKTSLEEKLEQGNLERSDMDADHKEMLAAIERKFFEEKGRLAKEYKQMLAEMKKSSQEEAVERLDASTKKILFENRRMAEELRVQVRPLAGAPPVQPRTPPLPPRLHPHTPPHTTSHAPCCTPASQVQETDELQKAKAYLEEENKKLRHEVELHEQSVKEYAKKGFRQTKEIKELGHKIKGLERSLSSSIRDLGQEKHDLALRDGRRIAEMELDSAGLRQLVKLKSKELANVKKLASIILHKRSEVETFLLEALEQVKDEMGKLRADEQRLSARYGRGSSGAKLPALGGGGAPGGRPSNLPTSADERVDIRDLTWEDRERVLRLLFAKINNAATQKPMPHHALIPPDPRAASFDPRLMMPQTGEDSPPGSPGMDDDVALFMTQPGVA